MQLTFTAQHQSCDLRRMMRPDRLGILILLIVGGCSSVDGPNRMDLAEALRTSPSEISALRCHGFPEEPTEYACRYRSRNGAGLWLHQEVVLAIDGSSWIVIDGPGAPHKP